MEEIKTSDEYSSVKSGKLKIIKNLTVIAAAICLLFTAYDGLSMLQSTMNKEQGIGTVSQAMVYAGFCISSLLLPKYVIKKVGCKVGLTMSTAFFIPYIAANFYPTWITMMPSALLLGIGASLLWGSQCTYFNESALMFCTLTEASEEQKRQDQNVKNTLDPNMYSTSVGNLSVISSPEFNQFKSTEELTANEISRNFDKYYENPDAADLTQSKEAASKRTSITSSLRKDDSTRRKFSVTLIAEDLESLRKGSDANGDININEISYSPYLDRGVVHGKSIKNLPDSFNKSPEEIEVCTHPNPRKSVGYIEALQKFAGLESVTAQFFGFSGFALHSAQVWSNLISYYVLHKEDVRNVTRNFTCACGADFCNTQSSCLEEAEAIGADLRNLLTGISVVLAVISVLILLFLLDRLPSDKEPVTFSFKLIMATFNHMRKSREQQFLIPISLYIGMLQGFYTADFTKSFVSCAWGTSHVGLVTIFYGIACAASSTSVGMLVKYTGRIPLMVLGQAFNLGVIGLLLIWTPDPDQPHLFYISAGMWGVVLGSFWALLPAFYGMIFKKDEEAAFGSYYLCSSMGWFVSFLLSDAICTSIKMYVLVGVSTVGMIGYVITEKMYYVKKNQISLKYAD